MIVFFADQVQGLGYGRHQKVYLYPNVDPPKKTIKTFGHSAVNWGDGESLTVQVYVLR